MAAVLNRIVKGSSRIPLGLLRENAESPFKSPDESVKLLLDEHFPGSIEPNGFSPGPDQAVVWDSDGPAGFITTWRVEKAIKSFGNFRSGRD